MFQESTGCAFYAATALEIPVCLETTIMLTDTLVHLISAFWENEENNNMNQYVNRNKVIALYGLRTCMLENDTEECATVVTDAEKNRDAP